MEKNMNNAAQTLGSEPAKAQQAPKAGTTAAPNANPNNPVGFGQQRAQGRAKSNDEILAPLFEGNKERLSKAKDHDKNTVQADFKKADEAQQKELRQGRNAGLAWSVPWNAAKGLATTLINGVGPHQTGIGQYAGKAMDLATDAVGKRVDASGYHLAQDMITDKDRSIHEMWDPTKKDKGLTKDWYQTVNFRNFAEALEKSHPELIGGTDGISLMELRQLYEEFNGEHDNMEDQFTKYGIPRTKHAWGHQMAFTPEEEANNRMYDLNERMRRYQDAKKAYEDAYKAGTDSTLLGNLENERKVALRNVRETLNDHYDNGGVVSKDVGDMNDLDLMSGYYKYTTHNQGADINKKLSSGDPAKVAEGRAEVQRRDAIKKRLEELGIYNDDIFSEIRDAKTQDEVNRQAFSAAEEELRRSLSATGDPYSGTVWSSINLKNPKGARKDATDRFLSACSRMYEKGKSKPDIAAEITSGLKDGYKGVTEPYAVFGMIDFVKRRMDKLTPDAQAAAESMLMSLGRRANELYVGNNFARRRILNEAMGTFAHQDRDDRYGYTSANQGFYDRMRSIDKGADDLFAKKDRLYSTLRKRGLSTPEMDKAHADVASSYKTMPRTDLERYLSKYKTAMADLIDREIAPALGAPGSRDEARRRLLKAGKHGPEDGSMGVPGLLYDMFHEREPGKESKAMDFLRSIYRKEGDPDIFTRVYGESPLSRKKTNWGRFEDDREGDVNYAEFMKILMSH